MIGTHTQQPSTSSYLPDLTNDAKPQTLPSTQANHYAKSSRQILSKQLVTHHPKAGLNPLVDAASLLFSVMGDLKHTAAFRQLHQLHHDLIQEISQFQETISQHGYNPEYVMICRYILCATFDDVIANTPWGSQGQWDSLICSPHSTKTPIIKANFYDSRSRVERAITLYRFNGIYLYLLEYGLQRTIPRHRT